MNKNAASAEKLTPENEPLSAPPQDRLDTGLTPLLPECSEPPVDDTISLLRAVATVAASLIGAVYALFCGPFLLYGLLAIAAGGSSTESAALTVVGVGVPLSTWGAFRWSAPRYQQAKFTRQRWKELAYGLLPLGWLVTVAGLLLVIVPAV